MSRYSFSHITPKIEELSGLCKTNYNIEPELYQKYEVKRGYQLNFLLTVFADGFVVKIFQCKLRKTIKNSFL